MNGGGLPACGRRKKITGEDTVPRDVLIHQAQDQGIEAVRPGAGRDAVSYTHLTLPTILRV